MGKYRERLVLFTSMMLVVLLGINFVLPVRASEGHPPLIVDEAALLSDSEYAELEEYVNRISDQYDMDIVIFTEYDSDIVSAMNRADDFYDENHYGRGTEESGLALYINMGTRDWWITTKGEAIRVFTDAGLDYIGEYVVDDLSSGYYYDACKTFVDLCDDFMLQAQNGEPYDVGNLPKGDFPLFSFLGTSILVGCVVAFIYIIVLKSQLKSVAPNNSAADYVVNGSMHITESHERFLYRNVTKVKKPEPSSSSGGGSSTHTSSSGSTHGGRGGKF